VAYSVCFGGSFNPPHLGHVHVACQVAARKGFEQVLLIPSKDPPHKPNATDLAPAEHRVALCRLLPPQWPLLAVDDLETHRAGPSYTIDTARSLAARTGQKTHWIIGADLLPQLLTWHQPAALLAEVEFVVVVRPNYPIDWTNIPGPLRHLEKQVVEIEPYDLSATQIRRAVREGRPWRQWVPAPVADYIESHRLYRVLSHVSQGS
jgi:nicotinate-nucleotide adenylyltransferase